MASYSMQLREYIEKWTQYEDGLSHRERIEIGRRKLFDFDYPIFDESYRNVFETHFIRNFYMREIGFEVEELFKFQLETWLIINMPYFNKLFESEQIKYNPLENHRLDVSHNKKNEIDRLTDSNTKANEKNNQTSKTDGQSHNESTNNSSINETHVKDVTGTRNGETFNRELESNNPDSRLSISTNDGSGVIEYASKIDENKTNDKENTTNKTTGSNDRLTKENASSDTTSTVNSSADVTSDLSQNTKTTSDIHELEDFIQHRVGKTGDASYAKLIEEYRNALLRIEKSIFNEMNELFMVVY